jgi:thymidylate synthase (FAD)
MSLTTEQLQDAYCPSEGQEKVDPLKDGISSVELVRISGSDLDVVNAARVSYGKVATTLSERDKKLINFLMMHDHTSPFEHNQLSFRIKTPIFVARQWMRHRMNSFNEISYRYVQAPLEFYVPHAWRFQDKVNHQASFGSFDNLELKEIFQNSIQTACIAYEKLLAQGVCREQARCVLPVATYTEFIYTCNLHSFLNFIKLRIAKGAQAEIRLYAEALLSLAEKHFPASIAAFKKKHGMAQAD